MNTTEVYKILGKYAKQLSPTLRGKPIPQPTIDGLKSYINDNGPFEIGMKTLNKLCLFDSDQNRSVELTKKLNKIQNEVIFKIGTKDNKTKYTVQILPKEQTTITQLEEIQIPSQNTITETTTKTKKK